MLNLSNMLCGRQFGNEALRYGHRQSRSEDPAGPAPRPVVVWAVTRACNLKCVHCYASASAAPAPSELTHEEGRALLRDLRGFGVPAVLFSGGEPLSRRDTPELIAYAHSLGLACTLSTNGLLIDDSMADRLATLGLRYAGISLDGLPERHDRLRGQQGAFAGSLAAIDRCRARGIRTGVRFTVHRLNLQDLDAVIDICLEHQVERLCVYHLAYAGRGQGLARVDLTAQETRAVLARLFDRTRDAAAAGSKLEVLTVGNHADAALLLMTLEKEDPARAAVARCLLEKSGGNRSGCHIAAIDPMGNVHADQFSWNYNCGNVRSQPFSKIWGEPTDPRLRVLRNRAASLPARCQSCRFLSVCNGNLRVRAESATGDWLGDDPACFLTEEELVGA